MLLLSACSDDWKENALTAKFTFDKTTYYVGEEVSITNETVGGEGNYTCQWDLGNGETSTEVAPKVTYETNGAYTVTLHVKDSKGNYAMAHKLLTIEAEPLPEVGNVKLKWVGAHVLGEIRSTAPAVSDDNNVYMTSNDHYLRKFSATTGEQLWEFDLWTSADGDSPSGNTHTTPSIDTDGTVYVGTGDTSGKVGRVYAINPDGTKKWVVAGDAEKGFWNKGQASKPRINYLTCAIGENHIYMGNGGSTGSVLAVDKNTGYRVGYVANADNSGGPSGGVSAGIALANNTLIWAGGKNGLFGASASALNTGGNVMWAWLYSSGNDKPSENMNASVAVDATGTIYGIATFPSIGSSAFAIGSDGVEKWRTSLGNVGTLDQGGVVIGLDGSIIVTVKRAPGEATGGIVALSPNGVVQWHYGVPEDVSGCAAIDQAGNIHFGTQSGNYYIIKPESSEEQLILKKDLAALISESDSPLKDNWEAGIGKIWSSPTIGPDGTIYIGVTHTVDPSKSVLVALEDEGITGCAASAWPMKGKDSRHTSAQLGGSGENPGGEPGGQLPITGNLKTDLKNLFDDSSYKVWLCAHRANTQKGIADGIPENSLTSIEYAINAGVEMIELDARPTSDGILVLMHDNTIDRTTNGSGAVGDYSYQQLQQLYLKDAAGNLTNERIPTLEDALKKGKGKVYFNLDIVNKNVAVATMVALLKKLDMENEVLLYVSNNRNYAYDLKAANSTLLLHPMAKASDDITYFASSYTDNVQMMQLSTSDALAGAMTEDIKSKGWLLFSNIVGANDTNMLSDNYSGLVGMINKRINVVQTDYAELAAKYLKSKKYR